MKKMIYFHAGDKVKLKHEIPNRPEMMVKRLVKAKVKKEENETSNNLFIGVLCCWFTKDLLYQEQIFSSKDLEKI